MTSKVSISRARSKYEQAKKTRVLHLNHHFLKAIPQDVWDLGTALIRLDLGFNQLRTLPAEIAGLKALEQLWLNDNPGLTELSSSLADCKKLRVLDVRRTGLITLPNELGRLTCLYSIVLDETPFSRRGGATTLDTHSLMAELERVDKREMLKASLTDKLNGGVYREVADSPFGQRLIPQFVEAVAVEFEELEELRNVVRNCDRLFPVNLAAANNPQRAATLIRKKFTSLRRENERKKLSAELELKLRAIYYDVIEPESVEGVIKSIYEGDWTKERPLELEDIQFLIKNAPRLFPKDPKEITGPGVRQAVWDLQDSLIREREEVVHKLFQAISASLYPDREPSEVKHLAIAVGKLFERDRFATKKELEEMRKLAADAAQHFPAEFHSAKEDPAAIRKSLKMAEAAAASLM